MKILRKKRPEMVVGDWMFHWDNTPVHTAAKVTDWMGARDIKLIEHLPYSPDLAPADFFLFPKVKRELAGSPSPRIHSSGCAKYHCGGLHQAFWQWFQRHEKCVAISSRYVEKS